MWPIEERSIQVPHVAVKPIDSRVVEAHKFKVISIYSDMYSHTHRKSIRHSLL